MPEGTETTPDLDLAELAGSMGVTLTVQGEGQKDEQAGDGDDSNDLSKGAKNKGTGGMDGVMLDDDEAEESDEGGDDHDDEESAEAESDENPEGEEADDEAEESAEEEDEKPEGDEDEQPPAVRKLLKRVSKLTARISERDDRIEALQRERDELQTRVQSATAITLQPTPENPLSQIDSLEHLDRLVAAAQHAEQWAEDNADGGEVQQADGTTKYLGPDEVKLKLRQARAVLRNAPARREFLAMRPAVDAEVRRFYPDLQKPGTKAHNALVAFLKAVPQARNLPNLEVMIGDMLAGQDLRTARAAGGRQKAAAGDKKASKESKAESEGGSNAKLPKTPTVTRSPKRSAPEAAKAAAVKRVTGGDRSDDAVLAFIENVVL